MIAAPDVLDALGNETRRAIVGVLSRGPQAVGQIAEALPISRPAVSKHLVVLERAGLVQHSADGTRNVYTLHRSGFDAARSWLDSFWTEALDSLAQEAAATWQAP